MDRRQTSSRSFIPRRSPTCGSFPFDRPMRLSVSSTTGSRFEVSVPQGETVEGLRRCLSQKLRVPRDRLVLLHKERQLNAGKLKDYGVTDDSKITMVPAVEAGLSTPRTEKTMVQALESLTEAQISDFLSGRTPLTLALGVGVHTMYVQLQLAAQNVMGQQQQPPQTGTTAWRGSKEQPADTTESVSNAPSGSTVPLPPANAQPSPTTPCHQTSSLVTCSPPPTQLTSRRLRAALDSPAPSSDSLPLVCHHQRPSGPSLASTPSPSPPMASLGRSATSLQAGCAVPSAPACSSPGPPSPVPASIFPETISHPSSSAKQREPGAVIESFVNHSPGVFSGTFSGTLPAVNQSGISHPRRGIAIILQILNDLLSATRNHQGAPNTLSQLQCPVPTLPAGASPTLNNPSAATQTPPRAARTERAPLSKPTDEGHHPQHSPTEENLTLRRKLEQLQCRMRQRRLRGRSGRAPHYSHPYHCRHGHAWSPGRPRAARYQSKDSSPAGKVASPGDSEMEVMEESPWKPELTSDLVVV